jgi:DNA-binding transcriptional LysR family regulator
VVAAREKSFTRAAEILALTQPSVTARIQGLETELKITLFLRKGRSIELTDGGKVFLPYATRALSVLDEAEEAVRNVREGTAGRISIGASQAISSNLIGPVLYRFHREFPQVEIFLRSGYSNQVTEMVLDDVVQFGMVVGPVANPQIRTLYTFQDELIVVTGADHPFARRRDTEGKVKPMGVEEFSKEEFIQVHWGNAYDLFMSRLKDASINPRISMEIGNTETAKGMAQSHAGITGLPRFTVRNELNTGSMVEIPLADIKPTYVEICAIQRRDRPFSQPIRYFLELWMGYVGNSDKF